MSDNNQETIRKLQNQLLQQQKLASIGQLTAGIVHEIQNPLNFVNNFANISSDLIEELNEIIDDQDQAINNDTREELLEIMELLTNNLKKIVQNGKRAESIVKGILLQSRGKPGVFQSVDLNDLVHEYVNLAYHGKRAEDSNFNASIKFQLDASVGKINVVPQDLSRTILNIVNNSCDAVHEKSLYVNNYSPTISVTTKISDGTINIIIRDNGTGIPEVVKKKIFDPFFSTKDEGKGTGLGLALSKEIIHDTHKGSIVVNSKENEFTEFIIAFPANLSN